jgi:hypothetical protein
MLFSKKIKQKNRTMKLIKKLFNNRTLALVCMVFFSNLLFAGSNGIIKGKILDVKNQPIEFATATLLNSKTKTFIKGEVSNEKGEFKIDKLSPGEYLLSVTMVGYVKNEFEKVVIDSKNTLVEKEIILQENVVQLATVEVTAKKKFIEQTVDKMVINPDASITSAGENVYEILKKLPGIDIDNNNNISLKGKQNVRVMIDDKPTYVSADQLAILLKSMQGKNVDRIEIMENPPARFVAEGNSGIINIKTRHNKAPGFNGSVNAGLSYSNKIRENAGIDMNMNFGKLNVYGNFNYSDWRGWDSMEATRRFTSTDMAGQYQLINNKGDYNGRGYNYKVGADYYFKKNQVLSVMFRGNFGSDTDTDNSKTSFTDANKKVDSTLNTLSNHYNNWDSKTYNVNYKWDIDTTGTSLSFDADYAHFIFRANSDQHVTYYDAAGNLLNRTSELNTNQGEDIDILSAKIDFVHPFTKTINFEAGMKSSFVTNNSNIDMTGFLSQNDNFIYKENIQAAYVNGNAQFNKTTIQLGLRLENTNSTGNSVTLNQVDTKSYLQLFPTFFAQQTLNTNNTINFRYSYRIGRPNYDMLNPFRWMIDPYTYNQGNPLLGPQFTHSASLSHTYKGILITSIGYSYTKDLFSQVLYQDDVTKTIYQTMQNLTNSIDWNASETVQLQPTKWWRLNGTVIGMFNEVNSNLDGVVQFKRWSYSGNLSTNFTLPYKVELEVSGNYSSEQLTGNFIQRPRYTADFGLQRKVLKDKGILRLSVNDIFNTGGNGAYSKYNNINIDVTNKYDSRKLNLTFSYNFGKDQFSTRSNRSTASSEEQSRSGK